MSITLTNLQTELQERIGSTANIKADTTKQKNALNRALDKMQSRANWMFTIRQTTFDYDVDTLEYSISTDLGLSDFKDVYQFVGKNLIKNNSIRLAGGEYYNIHIRDNDQILTMKLDGSDTVDLEYFSKYMVTTSGGTYQSRFSATGDLFLGDDELKTLLLELAYYEVIRNTKTLDKGEITRARDEVEVLMREAINAYGYVRYKGKRRIQIKL